MTINEWIQGGVEYVGALIPLEEQLKDFDAHDGVHWYLELGVSPLEEEYVNAWIYGLCGASYPMHPEWIAMGREDRSLLPIDLVNWLREQF
jgi:hypothetical protein